MKRKKYWYIVSIGIIIFLVYYYISYPEQLRENIYHQNGYNLTILEEEFPVEFEFKEEWFDLQEGEKKEINKVLLNKNSSTVILKWIYLDSHEYEYDVKLEIIQEFKDSKNGVFLSTMKIEKNSFFSGRDFEWSFYTLDGKEINQIVGGSSHGPGEGVSVRLRQSKVKELEKPFKIKYNFYLYQYDKL